MDADSYFAFRMFSVFRGKSGILTHETHEKREKMKPAEVSENTEQILIRGFSELTPHAYSLLRNNLTTYPRGLTPPTSVPFRKEIILTLVPGRS